MASANANAIAVSLPSGRHNAPAVGSNEAHQKEADARNSPMRATLASDRCADDASSPPQGQRPSSAFAKHDFVEQELIHPTSRLSRLPNTVPSSPKLLSSTSDSVAIPAFSNNNNIYSSQDVHRFVNNSTSSQSTEPRTFGQPSNLETSVSSSSQPLTTNGLTHPIRRPSRTSNQIFQSSSDLAAHYGIPQILPPAPRTHHVQQPAKQNSALPDFQTLSANYLNMLSKQPTDNSMAASNTTSTSTITPAELEAPVIPSDELAGSMHDFDDIFGKRTASRPPYKDVVTHYDSDSSSSASPEFRDSNDLMDFFTPQMPELDDFTSPLETPYVDFLNTPLLDDAMLTSPSMEFLDDRPLFAGSEYYKPDDVPAQSKAPQAATLPQPLYTISPNTPNLDSFEGNHLFPGTLPSAPAHVPTTTATTTPPPPSARRTKATGIRKGITPEALLDETAPTQPRKYTTPSATSRKEVPAVFQRKRSRSAAFGDEEDQLGDDLPLNPTEKDLIEQKRRQNTVAARRSRKRKLEQFQKLQNEVDEERRIKEIWKTRALTMLSTLQSMGVQWPDFPADEFDNAEA